MMSVPTAWIVAGSRRARTRRGCSSAGSGGARTIASPTGDRGRARADAVVVARLMNSPVSSPCRRGRDQPGPTSSESSRPTPSRSRARGTRRSWRRRRAPALDQIDDDRPEADLDRMGAHAEHDGLAAPDRRRDALGGAQVARARMSGAPQERAHGRPATDGSEEPLVDRSAAGRADGPDAGGIDGLRGAAPRPAFTRRPGTCRGGAGRPARRGCGRSGCASPWMRHESRLADTQTFTSTRLASGPPSPVSDRRARGPCVSTAFSTFGDLPLVEIAMATSPARPSASTGGRRRRRSRSRSRSPSAPTCRS